MRKFLIVLVFVLGWSGVASAQSETLYVSENYTTHVIFASDIIYADLSNMQFIAGRKVQQNKNMLALQARAPFEGSYSVSALESNGTMHTFIVRYDATPKTLVVDVRKGGEPEAKSAPAVESAPAGKAFPEEAKQGVASRWKSGKAPSLQEMERAPQALYHLGAKDYGISVMVEDIKSYSDNTYITLSLRNDSGVSYDIDDAAFSLETIDRKKRRVLYGRPVLFNTRYGHLAAAPGEYSRMVYSLEKLTLSKEQVLRIYFYEENGQRNLTMTLNPKDINL